MLELQNPVIAGVRKDSDFAKALQTQVSAIFLLKADVMTLRNLLKDKKDKKANRFEFLHRKDKKQKKSGNYYACAGFNFT